MQKIRPTGAVLMGHESSLASHSPIMHGTKDARPKYLSLRCHKLELPRSARETRGCTNAHETDRKQGR